MLVLGELMFQTGCRDTTSKPQAASCCHGVGKRGCRGPSPKTRALAANPACCLRAKVDHKGFRGLSPHPRLTTMNGSNTVFGTFGPIQAPNPCPLNLTTDRKGDKERGGEEAVVPMPGAEPA